MQPSDAPLQYESGRPVAFADRHIGPRPDEVAKMLATVGYDSLESLIEDAVPGTILQRRAPRLPEPLDEQRLYAALGAIAAENRPLRSLIGLGYYDTVMPAVIRRNLLENPGWYTAYTPYQPEISQGRLEALLVFQTMITELTGLPIANASLLDEATACVEAMMICRRTTAGERFLVDAGIFPQNLAVLETRARAVGAEIVAADLSSGLPDGDFFGVLLANPAADGSIRDLRPLVEMAHARSAPVVVATDLLALMMLRAPGEDGADIAVGSAQRFGMSLGYGGPHAGFLAARAELARSLPGRIVGVSRDAVGREALQLALQTREQHIRREKATSNICTAEVLPAVIAAMYAVYHGPDGLAAIARRVHAHACAFAATLAGAGIEVHPGPFFDTVTARVPGRAEEVAAQARTRGINVRVVDADCVTVAFDERSEEAEGVVLAESFAAALGSEMLVARPPGDAVIPPELAREGDVLVHSVFHRYHSETALMRLLRTFSDRDLALDRTMIPLGSCTMKLNSAIEMEPVSWPSFAGLHPFAPAEQSLGYARLISDLEEWLGEISGFDAVSLQPNAGSQGELAGLLAIRAYHEAQGCPQRRVCLIPSSAHGTNPASAQLAGFEVVVVACDTNGNVDLADLDVKIAAHGERLGALMITYPSTHGVYEREVRTITDAIHRAGAQVYLDGANLNALIGLARPGDLGADACHINLHKTFCIPHGGGGPGVGPLAVKAHLAAFLPGHPLVEARHGEPSVGAVAGAPFGSAGILPISWAYIRMMGGDGLLRATCVAVLSANYVVRRLAACYPVLYAGERGLVAHECVLDLRPLRESAGVSVEDVAKRLIDYGFHAPTMSFPVAGTLMIEPTESENLEELDRFCDAMIAIRAEIGRIESGEWPRDDNPLVNAPHTADELVGEWAHPYSREQAAYPLPALRHSFDRNKYWPPVKRVNQAFGDRNPSCTCPPLSDYGDS